MRSRAALLLALAALGAFALSQSALSSAAPSGRQAAALQQAPPVLSGPPEAPHRKQAKRQSWPALRVVRGVTLRHGPGRGAAVARISARTEFGSPRVLHVARRRGNWLGVVATERPNGRLAWVRQGHPGLRARRIRYSLHADLSRRRLALKRGGRVIKRISVAIGRPGSPTPRGRFAVTDKLSGPRFGSYYGCCILALTGKQPKPPPGWRGGNRLAIHGTNAPGTIGRAASAGCLRTADRQLRFLMRRVPLGTPVFIRR